MLPKDVLYDHQIPIVINTFVDLEYRYRDSYAYQDDVPLTWLDDAREVLSRVATYEKCKFNVLEEFDIQDIHLLCYYACKLAEYLRQHESTLMRHLLGIRVDSDTLEGIAFSQKWPYYWITDHVHKTIDTPIEIQPLDTEAYIKNFDWEWYKS